MTFPSTNSITSMTQLLSVNHDAKRFLGTAFQEIMRAGMEVTRICARLVQLHPGMYFFEPRSSNAAMNENLLVNHVLFYKSY